MNDYANSPTLSDYAISITKDCAGQNYYHQNDFSRERLRGYLECKFTEDGLKDKIAEAEYTILHESTWIWDSQNGISFGLAEYLPSTWKLECKGDIMNPYLQIDCMSKMWKKGEWTQWETWCNRFGIGNPKCDWANESL